MTHQLLVAEGGEQAKLVSCINGAKPLAPMETVPAPASGVLCCHGVSSAAEGGLCVAAPPLWKQADPPQFPPPAVDTASRQAEDCATPLDPMLGMPLAPPPVTHTGSREARLFLPFSDKRGTEGECLWRRTHLLFAVSPTRAGLVPPLLLWHGSSSWRSACCSCCCACSQMEVSLPVSYTLAVEIQASSAAVAAPSRASWPADLGRSRHYRIQASPSPARSISRLIRLILWPQRTLFNGGYLLEHHSYVFCGDWAWLDGTPFYIAL